MATKLSISIGNHTHKGMVRSNNQDSFGSAKNSWGDIYIVADGMGGHQGGEVASKMAVEHICSAFKTGAGEKDPIQFLDSTIQDANKVVIEKSKKDPAYKGMGTTIVAVIIKESKAYFAHVGDSRIYLYRYKKPYFVTKDHSVVQDLLDKGLINQSEAENHPQKNRILQAVGTENISITISTHNLYKGDYLLLCSDGLTGEVSDNDILKMILKQDPMPASKSLIDQANINGGSDNSTCIIIRVDKGSNPPKEQKNISIVDADDRHGNLSYSQATIFILLGIFLTIGSIITYDRFWKKTAPDMNRTSGQKFSISIDTIKVDSVEQSISDSVSVITANSIQIDSTKTIGDKDSSKNMNDTTLQIEKQEKGD